jgi:hypothetical protein
VIDEAALLSLWEQGQGRQPLDRALLLLWGCGAGTPGAALQELPLGTRDAALLRTRIAHFGPTLQATARCPHCSSAMAFELPLQQLAEAAPPAAAGTQVACGGARFRLPTSADLARALATAEPRLALAVALRVEGEADLDADTLAAVEAALADADPAAQIDIALRCEHCGEPFVAPFDPAECLWLDIARRAQQTLDEVHQLATAYGWSEAEVLAVPPARRRHYLQRVVA